MTTTATNYRPVSPVTRLGRGVFLYRSYYMAGSKGNWDVCENNGTGVAYHAATKNEALQWIDGAIDGAVLRFECGCEWGACYCN